MEPFPIGKVLSFSSSVKGKGLIVLCYCVHLGQGVTQVGWTEGVAGPSPVYFRVMTWLVYSLQ